MSLPNTAPEQAAYLEELQREAEAADVPVEELRLTPQGELDIRVRDGVDPLVAVAFFRSKDLQVGAIYPVRDLDEFGEGVDVEVRVEFVPDPDMANDPYVSAAASTETAYGWVPGVVDKVRGAHLDIRAERQVILNDELSGMLDGYGLSIGYLNWDVRRVHDANDS